MTTTLDRFRRLRRHARWANAELLRALRDAPHPPAAALREFAHVLGAEDVWFARIHARAPRVAIWPDLGVGAMAALADDTADAYDRFLATLADAQLDNPVSYTNSAGQAFATPLGDILLHVALHGQYHRGKVNLLLRQAGYEPAPVDYIAYVRVAPADAPAPTNSLTP